MPVFATHLNTRKIVEILDVIPAENGRDPIVSISTIDGSKPFRTCPRFGHPCIATPFAQVNVKELDAFYLTDPETGEEVWWKTWRQRDGIEVSQVMVGFL